MNRQKIELKLVENDADFKLYWSLYDEFIDEVFENEEIGHISGSDYLKQFTSNKNKAYIHKLFQREIDTAFPVLFIINSEVIGFTTYCTYHSEDGKCLIIDYYLLPEYRGSGLGSMIFEEVKKVEINKGAKFFELNISNRRNMNFWRNNGFRLMGVDEFGSVLMTTNRINVFLSEINEGNWMEAANLKVHDWQKNYVGSSLGILARGYVFRESNAKVFGIELLGELIGLTMIRDIENEPKCYEIQQFFIDCRFQNKGYGYVSLKLIIDYMYIERKYETVEISVKKEDIQAIKLYEKIGFSKSNYVDPDSPNSVNMIFNFENMDKMFYDKKISLMNSN